MHRSDDLRLDGVHAGVAGYYTRKIQRYGATPLGVDWTCLATQALRFVQLLRVCKFPAGFSLNDVGCGYGALVGYLAQYHADTEIDYLGIDLSVAMIRRAKRLHRQRRLVAFVNGSISPRVADYSIASGIFNVKLNHSTDLWEHFVRKTIIDMHATSRRGFSVNFMAPQSPGQPVQPELYRSTPGRWVTFCRQELGWFAEVLAEYAMRKFTLPPRPHQSAHLL